MSGWEPVTDPEVDAAWEAARASFAWADYSALLAHVPKAFLAGAMAADMLGADDIAVKDGRWERRFRGERAIVLPVFGATGDIVDLVAFRTEAPKSFWTFGAGAPMLGFEELERAHHFGEPLAVHETPLEWLKAESTGIVILDWTHYWPAYFGGIAKITTTNYAFGLRLTQMLENPLPTPEVMVPAS